MTKLKIKNVMLIILVLGLYSVASTMEYNDQLAIQAAK